MNIIYNIPLNTALEKLPLPTIYLAIAYRESKRASVVNVWGFWQD